MTRQHLILNGDRKESNRIASEYNGWKFTGFLLQSAVSLTSFVSIITLLSEIEAFTYILYFYNTTQF